MENQAEMISTLIVFLRKFFDASAEYWDNYTEQVCKVCDFSDKKETKWHFVIDSLCLLEDVQLAKENFYKFGIEGPTKYHDDGENCLRMYGIYNACYLEKQALIKIMDAIHLPIDHEEINTFKIFEFRKCFAAHTVNVGRKADQQSYILNREPLSEGKIEGYTLNSKQGYSSLKGDISAQIDEWNGFLEKNLFIICESLNVKLKNEVQEKASKISEAFDRIKLIRSGKCKILGNDVWNENAIIIQFVSPAKRDTIE